MTHRVSPLAIVVFLSAASIGCGGEEPKQEYPTAKGGAGGRGGSAGAGGTSGSGGADGSVSGSGGDSSMGGEGN